MTVSTRKTGMNDQWTNVVANGAQVDYRRTEMLPRSFQITAQLKGNPVMHTELLTGLDQSPTRAEVEQRFQAAISKDLGRPPVKPS